MNELELLKSTKYEKHEWIKTIETNCFSVSSFVLYPCHEICTVWMLCALYCFNEVCFVSVSWAGEFVPGQSEHQHAVEGEWKNTGHSWKEDRWRPHHGQGEVMTCNVYIVHKQKLYSLYIYLVHYSLLYMHTRYKFEVFGNTILCFQWYSSHWIAKHLFLSFT